MSWCFNLSTLTELWHLHENRSLLKNSVVAKQETSQTFSFMFYCMHVCALRHNSAYPSYCISGIVLHCRHCTALQALYCTAGIVLHCRHCTALQALYCIASIVLHCMHCTALQALYCTAGIVLHCRHCTALQALYCTAGIVLHDLVLHYDMLLHYGMVLHYNMLHQCMHCAAGHGTAL